MDLRHYQDLARGTDRTRGEVMIALLGLAGEAGEVLSEYKKYLRDGAAYTALVDRLEEELGDLLWYVAMTATHFGLDLDRIGARNLAKVEGRWARTSGQMDMPAPFDAHMGAEEQLPRHLTVSIQASPDERHATLRLLYGGGDVGDALTDNAYAPDGYRFHDVFHLAYMAVLGWSPVMRKLLKRKRKTDQRIDEVEDGGRAVAIEEAISAIVFDYARQHAFFEGIDEIDHSLLRTIKSMTEHLEVSVRGVAAWEEAILAGYRIWRKVSADGSGTIVVDLDKATIELAG